MITQGMEMLQHFPQVDTMLCQICPGLQGKSSTHLHKAVYEGHVKYSTRSGHKQCGAQGLDIGAQKPKV